MSAPRHHQPLSPLVGNVASAKHNYTAKTENDLDYLLETGEGAQEDNSQDSGSVVSGLTALENDGDDFDRLMIQNARDTRRLDSALQGRITPFRKARTHPRVALTMDNLEKNDAGDNGALHAKAHVKFESPPSSNGSARSDPAIQPPPGWGRKGRVRRDWLRTITNDNQEPGTQEDTIDRLVQEEETNSRRIDGKAEIDDADRPVTSVEDSPLSRKSSVAGTPASTRRRGAQQDQIQDWDLTMDLNEASLIASTPYIPRNTVLDDIRHREIETLREQTVTTSRLDKIWESSPEETRRRRSSSAHSTNIQTNGAATIEQTVSGTSTSEMRLRKRTNSWKSIGKSQVVTGEEVNQSAHSPVLVYAKSSETIGIVNRDLVANAPTSPKRPAHRREDSHDLLRRLARVSSSTPSPGRHSNSRPHTAPTSQPGSSASQIILSESSPLDALRAQSLSLEKVTQDSTAKTVVTAPATQLHQDQGIKGAPQLQESAPTSSQERETVDPDATPVLIEQSFLNPKTPVVTGAWIDTPVVRTSQRPPSPSRSLPRSPKKGSPRKRSPQKLPRPQTEEDSVPVRLEITRPTLPGSALQSIVLEAKSSKQRALSDDFGDSTINSLEDLIHPSDGIEIGDVDEDTLQGLQLPTGVPRNEAERQRQQELMHLHSMNQKLRAARTSIRDASRGMKRVEDKVEHSGEGGTTDTVTIEDGVKVIYRDCPCLHAGHPNTSLWTAFKLLFRDPRKVKRRGYTWLSIFLIGFATWFITENVACEFKCHQEYGRYMDGYGVDYDAPIYPIVLPTLFYRWFVRPWWGFVWGPVAWLYGMVYEHWWVDETARLAAMKTATRVAREFTRTVVSHQETYQPAGSMYDDEAI